MIACVPETVRQWCRLFWTPEKFVVNTVLGPAKLLLDFFVARPVRNLDIVLARETI